MTNHRRTLPLLSALAALAFVLGACGSSAPVKSADAPADKVDPSDHDPVTTYAEPPTTGLEPADPTTTPPLAGSTDSASFTTSSVAYPGTIDVTLSRVGSCDPTQINGFSVGVSQCMRLDLTMTKAPYGMPIRTSGIDGTTLKFANDEGGALYLDVSSTLNDSRRLDLSGSWWPSTKTGDGSYELEDGGEKTLAEGDTLSLGDADMPGQDGNSYQFVITNVDTNPFAPTEDGVVVVIPTANGQKAIAALTFSGDGGEALQAAAQRVLDQGD